MSDAGLSFCRLGEKIVLRSNADQMILSVVIVSYNVKFFLEQCLCSLKKAIEYAGYSSGEAEVFIVDNASADGSPDFLGPLYPAFHFIRNTVNTGFAKANNQALRLCKGELVLFLNPDTIMAEDCLDICVSFLQQKADAGGLGIHMVDGSGRFLRESKRGFPSPAASFFKMTGLAGLFPRSGLFAAYYMGHLDHQSSHAVDILSGAFMMVKKKVLDETGGFDEQFFMYAEDIDLSYRILKLGYKNYYLPLTTLIHFKGESTKKDFYYVKVFYHAMELFMRKHFSGKRSAFQLLALQAGVRLNQLMAAIRLPLSKIRSDKNRVITVFAKGDKDSKEEADQMLLRTNRMIAEEEKIAGEIIFCEGPALSWKSVIDTVVKSDRMTIYTFHGLGTHAAVGSRSSREQGQVFEI